MALQQKVYRNSANRKRGGVPGKKVDTGFATTGKTRKNYAAQIKSCHGGATDDVMKDLHASLKRIGKVF